MNEGDTRKKHSRSGTAARAAKLPKRRFPRLAGLSDAEIEKRAKADPDARPSRPNDDHKWHRPPLAHRVRMKLRLTQAQFAERYNLPIGTVRDWDQGRTEPDAAGMALLKAIAKFPDEVAKAQT